MDLYALKCFVNLAESLHFGKAGELSNLSPSALSRAIRRIEDEVGKPLFIRDNRSVSLTRAGELFVIYARDAIHAYRALQETLDAETEDIRGEVVIAASLSGGYSVLPEILKSFRTSFPGVNVVVRLQEEQNALSAVDSGAADAAVVMALPDFVSRGVLLAHLGESPLVFIAPKMDCEVRDRAAAADANWEEIPMVVTESDLSRRRTEAWFRGRGLRPKIYSQVDMYEEVIALVSLGCGVGVVPERLLKRSAVPPEVQILDLRPKLVGFNVGLATLKRRLQHPVVRAFWQAATEHPL